jgi:hypothetical protein
MATPEQIRAKLKQMAKDDGPAVSNIAKVKSVNETKATCVLVDEDDQEIFDVRLRPVLTGNKSFILVPKVGSFVLAVRVEDDEDWMVIAADEIEKIGYYIGTSIFEIDATGFLLKKQNETLKKIMVDLVGAVKAMSFVVTTPSGPGATATLNNLAQFTAIESRINEFLK